MVVLLLLMWEISVEKVMQGFFRSSRFERWLQACGFNLPPPESFPLDENKQDFPYYFSADEAFPLKTFIMRPYLRSSLTEKQRIFNFRLSLSRKTVECAFDVLTSKVRVIETPIFCSEKTVKSMFTFCIITFAKP